LKDGMELAKRRTMNLVPAFLFATLTALPASQTFMTPGAARAIRTLDVEIVDTVPRAAPRTAHHTLAVTDDAGWASMQSHGASELSLRARSNDDHHGNVLLEIDLHRGGEGGEVDVASALLFNAGHRTPFARIERTDGSIVELFVTAR
jgi:hypothetical protein